MRRETADAKEARAVLERNCYCVIATSSLDGRPWVSPVFYNYDSEWRIYWESSRECQHSQLIAANPRVAVVVADHDNVEGVYFESLAKEVPAQELAAALAVYLGGPHEKSEKQSRTAADYGGSKPLRLYMATPEAAYLLKRGAMKDGYAVDERVPLEGVSPLAKRGGPA